MHARRLIPLLMVAGMALAPLAQPALAGQWSPFAARFPDGVQEESRSSVLTGTAALTAVAAKIQVRPTSGPAGASVRIRGTGYPPSPLCEAVSISFTDAGGTYTFLATAGLGADGTFRATETIPLDSLIGVGTVRAREFVYSSYYHLCIAYGIPEAAVEFTVTA